VSKNNFPMYAGDTLSIVITVLDDAGEPVDLSDATSIRWQMATSIRAAEPLVVKELGDGIELVDDTTSDFEVSLLSEDTENIAAGTYYHEAEVILETAGLDPITSTVIGGNILLRPSLIKA
jgi:hypothetical protein